jgi:hypothetical protein
MNRTLANIWNDDKRLTAWTNAKLDEPFRDLPDEEFYDMRNSERIDYILGRSGFEQLRRGFSKLKQDNIDEFVETMAAFPQLRRYVRRRRRGRPDGVEPGLAEALADVSRINDLWQRTFGTRYRRSGTLTALDVAARRHGFDPETLKNYRMSRSRVKPGKI